MSTAPYVCFASITHIPGPSGASPYTVTVSVDLFVVDSTGLTLTLGSGPSTWNSLNVDLQFDDAYGDNFKDRVNADIQSWLASQSVTGLGTSTPIYWLP